jgi:membrane dipeptidase
VRVPRTTEDLAVPRTPLTAALLACLLPAAHAATPEATQLARDALIVDTHIDAPTVLLETWADLGKPAPDREFDHPRAVAGGLDVAFLSIYTSAAQDADGSALQVAHRMIDAVEALVQRHPDKFALLRSPREVEALVKSGRVLLPLGMENGAPLGEDLSRVGLFFARGVRYITLAHGDNNALADSSYAATPRWNGLSPLGRKVVAEMNRLGMMVDVSHLSDAAAMQAIALSTAPVVATHSAFRHFTPGFARNIGDAEARALAARGGVVQIPFGNAFVDPESAKETAAYFVERAAYDRRLAELKAKGAPLPTEDFDQAWDAAHPPRQVAIERVLDQVDYGVKLLGIDHIGIGSDFDGVGGALPEGLRTVADFPNLIAGLQARGYSDADIRKILGGNLLRVWRAVEDAAAR